MLQLFSRTAAHHRGDEKPFPMASNLGKLMRKPGRRVIIILKSSDAAVGFPNNWIPFQTYHLSCRGENDPNASRLLFCPAITVWDSFHTNFFRTVMNRRSKIIKGPYQLEVSPLNFLCMVLLLIFTHQFLSASYLRNITAQFVYFYLLNALISK